ncbi:uncharacterized protein [Pleurodeles waltl]|uniref:uncharacterized protein isoform X1 n=1 Tax=Pleurodeles waltl TaxID=8319 RepID=UPI0037097DEB
MSNYTMWQILHSRTRGTSSSSRITHTTGEEVPLQVVYTNTDTSPSLGRVEDDLALVPLTSNNLEIFNQVDSTPTLTDGAIYSVPPQETPTPPLTTAPPFARTASGYFADFNDDFSDSFASLTADLSSARKLKSWFKETYFIFPWNYLWLSLTLLALFLWIGFVITFFFLINGHFLPEKSTVELVEEVLKPHFSSHQVHRDLSFVNISAEPILDGIVWGRVMFDIYGPTEVIKKLYVFKLSMDDIVIPSIVSDDCDVKTVDSMMTELQYHTVFENEDVYQFKENYGDMVSIIIIAKHFIHRASSPKTVFNYAQWEHCPTPPQGGSKTYFERFAYFSGHNVKNAELYYFKVPHTKDIQGVQNY